MKKNKYLLLLTVLLNLGWAEAHTLPQCKAQLVVNVKGVLIHFKAPVEIIELAQKSTINLHSQASIDSLKNYFLSHISITDTLKSRWEISVENITIQETNDLAIGNYPEIAIDIYLIPSNSNSLREFTMNCDWVIHQIPTQSIIFSIEQDWQNGIIQHNAKQIGVIALDIPSGKISPLKIKLQEGSWWKGFKSMLTLGTSHIAEGTDHLLFLLVLLLPVPLLLNNKKWGTQRATRQSLIHILQVVTAFTIGHSFTLMFGALGWVFLPSKLIEVLIGISILVSAIHAIKPIFPNKETYIALGFGLIHGLAFANTLVGLSLDTKQMILSILGFNIGIELMQIFVILLTIPWLIVLSRTSYYMIFRVGGAVLAVIAAMAWIIERIFQQSNFITSFITKITNYSLWLLIILVCVSLLCYFLEKRKIIES